MKVIGLTGPSGSGKSEFTSFLAEYGIVSIDADKVYHSLLVPPSECLDELKDIFGKQVLFPDGSLDRHKLSEIVFASKEKLETLNRITHKYVVEKIKILIKDHESRGVRAVVIDAPLLFEAGVDSWCDFTVAILADRNIRQERIVERDSLSKADAQKRLANQKPDSFYTEKATFTIFNNSDASLLKNEAARIFEEVTLE